MPVTDAELNFLTVRVVEGFHLDDPLRPAFDTLAGLGILPKHSGELHDFEYLWQEQGQIDIFDSETRSTIVPTSSPCPWPDVETFLCRWTQILPEALARCFEKCHDPETYRLRCLKRPEIWGEVEVTPFTPAEAEFLDALYDEIRRLSYGPCLTGLTDREIYHGSPVELIARRRAEAHRARKTLATTPSARSPLSLARP